MGGHDIPEETIRRRYDSGLQNFFKLYQPLATTWQMYDNSGGPPPKSIAGGEGEATTLVADPQTWERIRRGYSDEG
jgi:predicted ABC-type ATPase